MNTVPNDAGAALKAHVKAEKKEAAPVGKWVASAVYYGGKALSGDYGQSTSRLPTRPHQIGGCVPALINIAIIAG